MKYHRKSTLERLYRATSLIAAVAGVVLTAPAASAAGLPFAHTSKAVAAPATDGEQRLETLGYKLATSNAQACQNPMMLTGLAVTDISAFATRDRAVIVKASGLGSGFAIRRIVTGSVGEQAGFARGDEIVAVNGKSMAEFAPELLNGSGSYDRTERFVTFLEGALAGAPAAITVRRGSETIELSLAGAPGCGGHVVLKSDNSLNAWADGRYVAVTTRMMRFADRDEELAFVVAHEMSHNILKHAQRLAGTSGLFGELGIGAKRIKAAEIEADTFAVDILANAGFDLSAPEQFLRHAGKLRWMDLATTHPGTSHRIAIVNAAVARHSATGAPLPAIAPKAWQERAIDFASLQFARRQFATLQPAAWSPAPASASLWHTETMPAITLPRLDLASFVSAPALAPTELRRWAGNATVSDFPAGVPVIHAAWRAIDKASPTDWRPTLLATIHRRFGQVWLLGAAQGDCRGGQAGAVAPACSMPI